MKSKCETCEYFSRRHPTRVDGDCRRYPPRLLESSSDFPATTVSMWCGEWKPSATLRKDTRPPVISETEIVLVVERWLDSLNE